VRGSGAYTNTHTQTQARARADVDVTSQRPRPCPTRHSSYRIGSPTARGPFPVPPISAHSPMGRRLRRAAARLLSRRTPHATPARSRAAICHVWRGRARRVKARCSLDKRVEQDTTDADGAAEHLDGLEGLAECDGDAHDDDDALGRVGDRLGGGRRLGDGERRELVVQVEVEAGGDEVVAQHRRLFEDAHEVAEARPLREVPDGEHAQRAEDRRERELVARRADALLEALGLHQLLVLVRAERREQVGDASGGEGSDREVELLDRGEAHAADDGDEAEPLGLR